MLCGIIRVRGQLGNDLMRCRTIELGDGSSQATPEFLPVAGSYGATLHFFENDLRRRSWLILLDVPIRSCISRGWRFDPKEGWKWNRGSLNLGTALLDQVLEDAFNDEQVREAKTESCGPSTVHDTDLLRCSEGFAQLGDWKSGIR